MVVRPVLLSSDDVKNRARGRLEGLSLECVRRSRSLYNPRSRTATAHQVRSSALWKKRPGEQVYLKAPELCQSRTEIYDGGDLKRVAEAVFSLGLYVFGMYIVMFGLDERSINPCAVGAR